MSCWSRATRPSQWLLLGEDIARGELAGACEGQILAHGIRWRCRRKPWTGQAARRIRNPVRDAPKPTLLRQIFRDRADQRVKPFVAGQFWLALDRGIAVPIGTCRFERVNKFSQDDVPGRTGLNRFNRLSEGIWAHLLPLRDSCASAGIAASQGKRRSQGSTGRARLRPLPWTRCPKPASN